MSKIEMMCDACKGLNPPEKMGSLAGQCFCEKCLKHAMETVGYLVPDEGEKPAGKSK